VSAIDGTPPRYTLGVNKRFTDGTQIKGGMGPEDFKPFKEWTSKASLPLFQNIFGLKTTEE